MTEVSVSLSSALSWFIWSEAISVTCLIDSCVQRDVIDSYYQLSNYPMWHGPKCLIIVAWGIACDFNGGMNQALEWVTGVGGVGATCLPSDSRRAVLVCVCSWSKVLNTCIRLSSFCLEWLSTLVVILFPAGLHDANGYFGRHQFLNWCTCVSKIRLSISVISF